MSDLQTEFLHLVGTLMGHFLEGIALLRFFGPLTQHELSSHCLMEHFLQENIYWRSILQ